MQTSRWRTVVVAVVAVLAGIQLLGVTITALPPQIASDEIRRPTAFLDPFFSQDWRLFAPNPIGADRNFQVQAVFEGSSEPSAWVDVTDLELDLVREDLLGGRAGYGSLKMVLGLDSWWTSLSNDTRNRLEDLGAVDEPASRSDVAQILRDEGTPPGVMDAYLGYDEAAVTLASDVLRASGDVPAAVRYRVRVQSVVPWSLRDDGTRPPPHHRTSGWFVPAPRDPDRSGDIARFVERHR